MPSTRKRPARTAADSQAATPTARVRRGNADDHERMRQRCLGAAEALFASGGVEAVTMRAVAAKVGVSPMAPYRYFHDKAELLSGLWQSVIRRLCDEMRASIDAQRGGRERQRASIDAFLGYWERYPDHYRLVYMTEQTTRPAAMTTPQTGASIYAEILEVVRSVTQDLADEIGATMKYAKLAGDIRFAMMLGYLQGTLINQRYPWTARQTLREAFIEQVIATVERCLLHGPLGRTAPAARQA
jgi:AcrR family transcriptional regulator